MKAARKLSRRGKGPVSAPRRSAFTAVCRVARSHRSERHDLLRRATICALLEAVPTAVFILDGDGHVRRANRRGRRMLTDGGPQIRRHLKAALRGSGHGFERTRLSRAGHGPWWLLVANEPARQLGRHLRAAVRRWRLTARQREVLQQVADGASNRDVAEALGMALSTAELHVSALLAAADVPNRAALVSRLWTLT